MIYFFGYLIIFVALKNALNESILLGEGDINRYYNSFKLFVDLKDQNQLYFAEPTFKVLCVIAGIFPGYDSILYLITLVILLTSYFAASIFDISLFSLLIYFFSFLLPFNNATKFLLTSWRSTLSILFLIIFYASFFKEKTLISLKVSIYALFALISHSTSIVLTMLFTFYFYLNSNFVSFIRFLKIKKSAVYALLSLVILLGIVVLNLESIDYLSNRLVGYLSGAEYYESLGSLSRLTIKFILLTFVQFFIKLLSKDNKKKLYFNTFIFYTYFLSIIIGLQLSVFVADRIVLALSWLTVMNIIDISIKTIYKGFNINDNEIKLIDN